MGFPEVRDPSFNLYSTLKLELKLRLNGFSPTISLYQCPGASNLFNLSCLRWRPSRHFSYVPFKHSCSAQMRRNEHCKKLPDCFSRSKYVIERGNGIFEETLLK